MKDQKALWDKEYKTHALTWNKDTRTLPKILKGKRVLEVGVGTGKTLRAILSQKPREVYAIDISKEALKKLPLSRDIPVMYMQANVTRLPFKNEEWEFIVCYYIFNNLLEKQRKKAVEEIFRTLKPQGKVIFEDFAVGDFRQKEGRKIAEENTIEKKNGIKSHFFSKEEVSNLFKEFSKNKINVKTSSPITHKPGLKRKIISGIITK